MRKYHEILASVLILLAVLVPALCRADASLLLGQWEEKFPNGARLVFEFTPKAMSSWQVGPFGKQSSEPNTRAVEYELLTRTATGATYGLKLKTKDGKPAGRGTAIVRRGKELSLTFPGVGSHALTRVER